MTFAAPGASLDEGWSPTEPLLLLSQADFAVGDAQHFDPHSSKRSALRSVYASDIPPAWSYPAEQACARAVPKDLRMLILRTRSRITLRIILSVPSEFRTDTEQNVQSVLYLVAELAPGLGRVIAVLEGRADIRRSVLD
ncbi:hypothetical protein FV222_07050 [Methylobacterium sp. WL103]|uniref:hypothetical protein n=1 Tax=Methylobacterium sp. WL103 TaxID=2603891 RepID=UPI0011C9DC2D|nr:hypothetical protein [Methylobacterium sp. WL103]TXN04966.1 hypothetical protein FV222_07050 [Methylobacterium sp. WL103]